MQNKEVRKAHVEYLSKGTGRYGWWADWVAARRVCGETECGENRCGEIGAGSYTPSALFVSHLFAALPLLLNYTRAAGAMDIGG